MVRDIRGVGGGVEGGIRGGDRRGGLSFEPSDERRELLLHALHLEEQKKMSN